MAKLSPDIMHDIIAVRRTCIYSPTMVPVVIDGMPYASRHKGLLTEIKAVSVADFVLGWAALGITFPYAQRAAGGIAVPVSFGFLPSRWGTRARSLWNAFGPDRHEEIGGYLQDSGLRDHYSALEGMEEIQCHGTVRKAILAHAAIQAVRAYGESAGPVFESLRLAEPMATAGEIAEALREISGELARVAVEDTAYARTEARR